MPSSSNFVTNGLAKISHKPQSLDVRTHGSSDHFHVLPLLAKVGIDVGRHGNDAHARCDGKPSPVPWQPDRDLSEVVSCFAGPRRFGHHGLPSDVRNLAYESTNVSRECAHAQE